MVNGAITIDDIKLLISTGEGFNAEFKTSVPSKVKEISEEVCAFANAADFGKKSHSRNPLILGLFARMNLVEQLGSGLIRMRNLMKAASLKEPIFKTQGIFTVVFSRPKTFGENQKSSEKTKNLRRKSQKPSEKSPKTFGEKQKPSEKTLKTSEKILALVKTNPKVTIEELSASLNKSTRAIELQLSKLKEQGLIARVGSDKLGEWKVR